RVRGSGSGAADAFGVAAGPGWESARVGGVQAGATFVAIVEGGGWRVERPLSLRGAQRRSNLVVQCRRERVRVRRTSTSTSPGPNPGVGNHSAEGATSAERSDDAASG